MNRIWELDRVYTNLLLTQQKLLTRQRVGAKVIKRHDTATTPYQRVINAKVLSPAQRGALTRARNTLQPGVLQREIARLCAQLERLALSKTSAPPRAVNRAFKDPRQAEVPS